MAALSFYGDWETPLYSEKELLLKSRGSLDKGRREENI
jgi:hypothetical protein